MTGLFWTNLIMVSSIRIISASQTTRGQASQFSPPTAFPTKYFFNIRFLRLFFASTLIYSAKQ
jgi:hypothetical protein